MDLSQRRIGMGVTGGEERRSPDYIEKAREALGTEKADGFSLSWVFPKGERLVQYF